MIRAQVDLERSWEERVVRSMNAASAACGVSCCDQIPGAFKNLESQLLESERQRRSIAAALKVDGPGTAFDCNKEIDKLKACKEWLQAVLPDIAHPRLLTAREMERLKEECGL